MIDRLVWLGQQIRDPLFCPWAKLFPRNRRKVLFGAWGGRQYSDNPKYFLLHVLEQTDLCCVWIGEEYLRGAVEALRYGKRLRFVRKGSPAALWHFLTAGIFVFNINWRSDICNLPLSGRVLLLNLWHGIPFKKVGERQYVYTPHVEQARGGLRNFIRERLIAWSDWCYPQASWTSVSSAWMAEELVLSFPGRFSETRAVCAGLPRNDLLVNHRTDAVLRSKLKQRFAQQLNLPVDKRWYLYLPTFRYGTDEVFSFSQVADRARLEAILGEQGAVIVEKQHPRVLQRLHVVGGMRSCVWMISESEGKSIDLQELLLVSDRLITDYSSCFFDFALLQRPVIHFAYDYKAYVSQDTGVTRDLREVCAGPICRTQEELLNLLAQSAESLLTGRGERLSEMIGCEQGRASAILCERLGLQ